MTVPQFSRLSFSRLLSAISGGAIKQSARTIGINFFIRLHLLRVYRSLGSKANRSGRRQRVEDSRQGLAQLRFRQTRSGANGGSSRSLSNILSVGVFSNRGIMAGRSPLGASFLL